LAAIRRAFVDGERELDEDTHYYTMNSMECKKCGTFFPPTARYCRSCSDNWLNRRYCGRETRAAAYLDFVSQCALNSRVATINSVSLSGIPDLVAMKAKWQVHDCTDCPLKGVIDEVVGDIKRIVAGVKGLSLEDHCVIH
jgi:ribosomal protein L40E